MFFFTRRKNQEDAKSAKLIELLLYFQKENIFKSLLALPQHYFNFF